MRTDWLTDGQTDEEHKHDKASQYVFFPCDTLNRAQLALFYNPDLGFPVLSSSAVGQLARV